MIWVWGVVGYLVVSLITSRIAYAKQCFNKDGSRRTYEYVFHDETRTADTCPGWALSLFLAWPLVALGFGLGSIFEFIYKALKWFYTPASARKLARSKKDRRKLRVA